MSSKFDISKIKNLIDDQLEIKIGDPIYHKTPNSPQGIVLSWMLNGNTGEIEYYAAFGPGDTVRMYKEEVSKTRIPDYDNQ